MQKAIFLDRDGVLNHEVGDYIKRFEDFKLLDHIYEGLKLFFDSGYLLIVITNQGGIAKGEYTHETLSSIHDFMFSELRKHGIEITEIYYCPHHPIVSHCLCRKPGSLLVEKAVSKYLIDPKQSFFIGDKQRDIDCGEAVGVSGILIESNENWLPHAQQICSKA
jgi:D-glycero-D-manno-heptose 1,7-bisphosphate phosphatase